MQVVVAVPVIKMAAAVMLPALVEQAAVVRQVTPEVLAQQIVAEVAAAPVQEVQVVQAGLVSLSSAIQTLTQI
jgi:hypothetical protein